METTFTGRFTRAQKECAMPVSFVVSCEHASPAVPPELVERFADAGEVMTTHRAWDAGARPIAEMFAATWGAPLFCGEATRLVCDLNRSIGNKTLWSEWTRDLPPPVQAGILKRWYHPYRDAVTGAVASAVEKGGADGCFHLSVHSFTPVWKGEERKVDLGLLYDPARPREKALALAIQDELGRALPDLRIRRNAPYRGVADSLTSFLHKRHSDDRYVALELEFNQGGRYPSTTAGPAGALAAVAVPLAAMLSAALLPR